jgi:hypothetical protein
MFTPVNTREPRQVEAEVQAIYSRLYPAGDRTFVATAFDWASQCFSGCFEDYQAIDARYHDFEHTLQGTLCLVRLLQGRHIAGAEPQVSKRWFELTLLAILFHDTGYLKKRSDTEGTGAKYTLIHVARSAEFARDFLAKKGLASDETSAVANMISCTGVNADLGAIPFRSDVERICGYALATADLLGQMAAPDYVEKLPVLFQEFNEAAHHSGTKAGRLGAYKTSKELMEQTPAFWQTYVLPKIDADFGGLYDFLSDPYPSGPNYYLDRIRENLARLGTADMANRKP